SSPRGKKYAVDNFPKAKIRELPFDITFLIKRFINIYNPKALIIVEEELWLNLIKASSKNIPVVLINGRISPSSFKVYKFLSFIYKKDFQLF
ncbi:glycosyltransferase N-terminal domain-containing protein, partial [Hydrogenivirga sp. 128-5-R1-1]|uniref:glycosyltransferase N-terminal domain-containing protein n=1 Tax=Hydrogenivirga sp. 128-5-R1-1 TaxID=392423 RepID=UPI00015F28A3